MRKTAKPFVKWAGGKGRLLDEIRANYPAGMGERVRKYAEPFVGGGAVLFDVLNRYEPDEVYISDINGELIYTYTAIRDHAVTIIEALRAYEFEYISAKGGTRKEFYYARRQRFNALRASRDKTPELAALFLFLNRTCFNGLYRVNANGCYNVPQGDYPNPRICDSANLLAVSERLRGVTIVHGDYRLARDFIDEKTFVYFDPPYRPLTETSCFTAYSQDRFTDHEQVELARFIGEMSGRGAWVVASNSDPKNKGEDDCFFDSLYSGYRIIRVDANRAINSDGGGRGRIKELLIVGVSNHRCSAKVECHAPG